MRHAQDLAALPVVVDGPGFPPPEPGPNVHDADDGIANGGHHECGPEDCAQKERQEEQKQAAPPCAVNMRPRPPERLSWFLVAG